MAENSAIEWTDHTFNPWMGCSKVSPGCDHCYAEAKMDTRLHRVQWGAGKPRVRTKTWGMPERWNSEGFYRCRACGQRGSMRTMVVTMARGCPHADLDAVRPRVFCASLADVFDNEVPPEWRDDLAALILNTPNLDWLLLSKRIGNAGRMLGEMFLDGPPPNLRVGTSAVTQEEWDREVPKLLRLRIPNFVSLEPLLGRIDACEVLGIWWNSTMRCYESTGPRMNPDRLDWVIVGGESGPGARPMHPDWARSLRDQCAAAGVPFLFKQWGEWAVTAQSPVHPEATRIPGNLCRVQTTSKPDRYVAVSVNGGRIRYEMDHIGKKAAGRLLDGVEHNGFPEVAHA